MRVSYFGVTCLLPLSEALRSSGNGVQATDEHEMAAKRVAIIGAGAGGSSAAYHLAQYASNLSIPTEIHVFERSNHVGGRTTTVRAWGSPDTPVELGGSIFVSVNRILVEAAEKFNLTSLSLDDRPGPQGVPELGIWNGKEFVVVVEGGDSWWEKAKLLWRYGLAPIKTNQLMKSTVGKFLTLYDEPIFPWKSLSEVAQLVDLTQTTGVTGEQFLKSNGIGDKFASEIVQASTRVNYASNLGLIHGLETMVCMATNGAMAVEGGNWQIFSSMLNSSSSISTHFKTPITHVSKQPDGSYVLQVENGEPQRFDSVVLASPLQFSKLIIDPAPQHTPDQIPYVNLHVTLFASPYELDPAAFNLPAGEKVPQFVLTTLPDGEDYGSDPRGVGSPGFFSISIVSQAQNQNFSPPGRTEWIYKIFSAEEVDGEFLSRIIGHKVDLDASLDGIEEGRSLDMAGNDAVTWVHKKLWHSYPYEFPRVTFEELKLDDDLWYTSGIESFISTMETSALMGKNVAKLIANRWAEGTKGGQVVDEELRIPEEGTWEFDGVGNGKQKPLKAKL